MSSVVKWVWCVHVCVYILRFVVYKILRRYEEYVKEIFFFSFFNSFLEFLFSELIFKFSTICDIMNIKIKKIWLFETWEIKLLFYIIPPTPPLFKYTSIAIVATPPINKACKNIFLYFVPFTFFSHSFNSSPLISLIFPAAALHRGLNVLVVMKIYCLWKQCWCGSQVPSLQSRLPEDVRPSPQHQHHSSSSNSTVTTQRGAAESCGDSSMWEM